MSVARLSGSWSPWSCKGSSQAAEDSWFPIDEDECHDMRTGDPGSKMIMHYCSIILLFTVYSFNNLNTSVHKLPRVGTPHLMTQSYLVKFKREERKGTGKISLKSRAHLMEEVRKDFYSSYECATYTHHICKDWMHASTALNSIKS